MSPYISLMFVLTLVLHLTGCAGTAEPKPMEAPVDMNLAENSDKAQENPFAKAYVKRDLPAIALQPDPSGPKVYRGQEQIGDYQRMLENGYDMMGYSEFMAGEDVQPALLEQHAKEISADLALVYTRLSGEVPASVQVQQMRERAKNGEQAGEAETQVSYNYFASYWAKLAPPLLGVHVTAPAEDSKTDGLKVIAVIHESPADKAGLHDGDVLKRLGDVTLKSPVALTQAAQRYAGQTVDMYLQRGQDNVTVPEQLNRLRNTARK